MKRFASLILCGALLAVSVYAAADAMTSLQNGLHPTRGGNIYIQTPVERTRDTSSLSASILFYDPSQKIFGQPEVKPSSGLSMTARSVDIVDVADIIAQSIGVPVTKPGFQSPFVRASLLNAASTNVLVGIHGFTSLTPKRYQLPKLTEMEQTAAAAAHLTYNASPRNPVAVTQSLASGKYPVEHGIVGARWLEADANSQDSGSFYKVVDAYSSENARSLVPSIAQRVSAAFNDVNNAFTFSGHGNLGAYAFGDNGLSLRESYVPVESLLESKDAFQALSNDHVSVSLTDSKTVVVQRLNVPVHLRPGQFAHREPATFDLNKSEVADFFAELIYFDQMVQAFATSRAIKNHSVPDFLSFIYTSYPGLTRAVRNNQLKVETAAALVDAHAAKLLATIERHAKSGHFVAEVALLGSTIDHLPVPVVDRRVVLTAVKEAYPAALTQPTEFYPAYFVPASEVATVCADVTTRLLRYKDIKVVCALDADGSDSAVSFLEQSVDVGAKSTGSFSVMALPEGEDVNRYQIVLWTFVILFFVTCYAISSTIFMEFKKDQSLWGTVQAVPQ